MAEISLAVNDVNIVKGIIVITLKEQLDFESIYLKHRKNDEKIACDYNVLDNKIFVKIEKYIPRGRYDLFIEEGNDNIRACFPSVLKKSVEDRYSIVAENAENLNFAYFTLDGHLALHVVDKDNNGHFNQFSGKMTVDAVSQEATGSVGLTFRTPHIFKNLNVYLMEQNSSKKTPISFRLNDKTIELNIRELKFDYAKLIVIHYEDRGVFQSRWLDFSKWAQNSLSNFALQSIDVDEKMGELDFGFFVESINPIEGLELIVRNRSTREEFSSINTNEQSLIHCRLNANDFPVIKTSNDEPLFETYDGNIFDFLIRPIFKWIPCINYRVRIEFNNQLEDEFWFNKNNEVKQLVMMYQTKVGKLAARFAYLPQKSFNRYKLLLNTDIYRRATNNKKILLVSEYINKAQDTGLHFFKYMVDNHKEEFDTYYIITEHSKDLSNLEGYMDNVIFYRSVEHIDIVWQASYLAHSHSSIYAFPFNSKRMNNLRLNMHKLFLQHGIMGVRDLGYLYQNDPLFTNKIVVSSNREKKIAEEKLQYPSDKIAITGLSRFDRLMKYKSLSKKQVLKKKVLIMPSWRKGEDKLTDEDFMNTQFYKEWQSLINDSEFCRLVRENSLIIDVYLHHNFQQYQHLFYSPCVNFINEGSISVQDLLINHGLLITDFSSVGLDFSLLDRPVLYFNFDNLFDFQRLEREHFLPGEVIEERDNLIRKINYSLKSGKLKLRYRLYRRKNIYKFTDQNANNRIFMALKRL